MQIRREALGAPAAAPGEIGETLRFRAVDAALHGLALRRDHHRDIRFVDRAGLADQVAEGASGAFAIAREAVDRFRIFPAAIAREPQRCREMMEGDDRKDPERMALRNHAAIMIERSLRMETFFRFDARPLDRETVGAETETFEQREVMAVPMIVIARIAGRFRKKAVGRHLHQPQVARRIAAFHLMRGRCGAPEEVFRKLLRHDFLPNWSFAGAGFHRRAKARKRTNGSPRPGYGPRASANRRCGYELRTVRRPRTGDATDRSAYRSCRSRTRHGRGRHRRLRRARRIPCIGRWA